MKRLDDFVSVSAYTRDVPIEMPRVAYFPDSFHEVNGVAHTSRHFEAYAQQRGLPFLCVRAGDREQSFQTLGSVSTLELRRGFLSFALDKDLRYDPGFLRHLPRILRTVREFRPEVIHITGPSELGMLGAMLAHHLHVPLVASWHTNVHEYLARRSHRLLRLLSSAPRPRGAAAIERGTFRAVARFYSQAQLLFAPNPNLCRLLEQATRRPCQVMPRGVDATLFSPEHRTRPDEDGSLLMGYVGRLSVEKNIRLLAEVQAQVEAQAHATLNADGSTRARFLIVGQGAEEEWLRGHLPGAEFAGVLRGAELARAYANMDCFVFPSRTDTFGNVVLEALASGVPAIVTPQGGPAHLVEDGVTGYIVEDGNFGTVIAKLFRAPERLRQMRAAARSRALSASWDGVFDGVYEGYKQVLRA